MKAFYILSFLLVGLGFVHGQSTYCSTFQTTVTVTKNSDTTNTTQYFFNGTVAIGLGTSNDTIVTVTQTSATNNLANYTSSYIQFYGGQTGNNPCVFNSTKSCTVSLPGLSLYSGSMPYFQNSFVLNGSNSIQITAGYPSFYKGTSLSMSSSANFYSYTTMGYSHISSALSSDNSSTAVLKTICIANKTDGISLNYNASFPSCSRLTFTFYIQNTTNSTNAVVISNNYATITLLTNDNLTYALNASHVPMFNFSNSNTFNFLGCSGSSSKQQSCSSQIGKVTKFTQLFWFLDYFESDSNNNVVLETNGAFPLVLVPDASSGANLTQVYLFNQLIVPSANNTWSQTWNAPVYPPNNQLNAAITVSCTAWENPNGTFIWSPTKAPTPPKSGAYSILATTGSAQIFSLIYLVYKFVV